jgi:snoRNA binding domain, fibrillarin
VQSNCVCTDTFAIVTTCTAWSLYIRYGIIYHSTFIGRAAAKNKGRISRVLANKCSIASRIDSFIEEPTTKYGEELREQVEERLKFYDTGKFFTTIIYLCMQLSCYLVQGLRSILCSIGCSQ